MQGRSFTRSWQARTWTAVQISLLHVAVIAALVTGTSGTDWAIFAIVFPIQFAGVAICLHRYFAHHSFHTSRAFQFVLALCAASCFGDPIRFAGKHRLHHQHADKHDDPHTPMHGFWAGWFGSHGDSRYTDEEIQQEVPWLARYPELVWLHRHSKLPGFILCVVAFLLGGFDHAFEVVLFDTFSKGEGADVFGHERGKEDYVGSMEPWLGKG